MITLDLHTFPRGIHLSGKRVYQDFEVKFPRTPFNFAFQALGLQRLL